MQIAKIKSIIALVQNFITHWIENETVWEIKQAREKYEIKSQFIIKLTAHYYQFEIGGWQKNQSGRIHEIKKIITWRNNYEPKN